MKRNEMRRSELAVSPQQAWKYFDQSPFQSLACIDENNHPYVISLSMARINETIYFHCAKEGKKIICFQHHKHVSVSVVSYVKSAQDKFTTYYESAHFEGIIEEVVDQEEKIIALKAIAQRYTPSNMDKFMKTMKSVDITSVYKIHVEAISGKCKQ